MGHHDNEGTSGITRAKEKERKDQAKVLASNSKVTATHAACGVTKHLFARHKAKERTMQDGILATEAKTRQRWNKGIYQRARARE